MTRLERHPNHRPFLRTILQRPQLQEYAAPNAAIRALLFRRFVVNHFVRVGVVAEHKAEMFGRFGARVIVHADDGGDAGYEVRVKSLPL